MEHLEKMLYAVKVLAESILDSIAILKSDD